MEKPKPNNNKSAAKPAETTPPPTPVKVPPLFRRIDWITMILTFVVVWTVYLFTLAPEQTLEDSGELCTGSFYAGIPHPPGYPFWAIYSWFWTAILPIGNVAWRVEVGESFALAMGCAMVALMVSRGGSMLIEGIEELKAIAKRWEAGICMVSGFVAGTLVGLDSFVWSESVVINRISVFAVPWLVMVLLMLMRWLYSPRQRQYLYLAMFFYGICATIHQTLLLSAMGVEVAIAAVDLKLGRDLFLGNSIIYIACLLAMGSVPALAQMNSTESVLFHIVGVGSILASGWLCLKTHGAGTEILAVIIMGILWMAGVSFYFYEPLAGMTCPPMQWGYPRTVEGFFHAISRGQYEGVNATDIFHNPLRFGEQLWYVARGLSESFSWVFMFVGALPYLFITKMQKRERGWIIGLSSVYFCLAILLVILLNVGQDRASSDLCKVFFTASHTLFAVMIGYGMTLLAAFTAAHYDKFRRWGLIGSGIATLIALICLWQAVGTLYFGPGGQTPISQLPHWIAQAFAKDQYGSPVFANLILVALPIVFAGALLAYRSRGPVVILLGLFLLMPVYSGLSHWYKSEQRNHWFGYWFGHDMFTPPFGVYPEMTKNAILFGGTDPGRFCPTYMIFCESFIPHDCQPKEDQKFDRRDVYIITQNALADGTYLDYIRSQYFRSAQQDPPFFSELLKDWWWALIGPIFALSILWIGSEFILGTRHRNRNAIIIACFWVAGLGVVVVQGDGVTVQGLCKAAYKLLDVPFTKLGANIEKRRRAEGVYPPVEIYTPSPDDSQNCFRDYTEDVARRQQLGQLKPGETVNVDPASGRVQVSGQVAVMMINGLLCKVIFDHNPTNEFFVEESFPLDWMYPYETPFGVIMKINRDPLTTLPDDVYAKDHEFWTKYSTRLCGNWIGYDTSVQQIADFVEKVYLHNDFAGFTGDRRFVRDDDGQKAFSKLRSSQAGVYAWRCSPQCPPEYRPKTQHEMEALVKETDFAFKQSFAFCPYSPEAVYRYVNFLLQFNRLDDALIVAQTCLKLDPYNDQITDLISRLSDFKKQSGDRTQVNGQLQQMETEAKANPGDFQNILQLGRAYGQLQQTAQANDLFKQAMDNADVILNNPKARYEDLNALAQICALTGNLPKLEPVIKKIVSMMPDQPEPRYDLAALEAVLGKSSDSLANLQTALEMNAKRLQANPGATNLLALARSDPRFNGLRNLPEFQKLVSAP